LQYTILAIALLASSSNIAPTLAAVAAAAADLNLLFARSDKPIGTNRCTTPIVNVYAYSTATCRSEYIQGVSDMTDSPIYFGLKFAPDPSLLSLSNTYQSYCKDMTALTVGDPIRAPARSLAFSADGAATAYCKLHVFLDEGCKGAAAKMFNLNGAYGDAGDVGFCEVVDWRSARVVCSRTKKNEIVTFDRLV